MLPYAIESMNHRVIDVSPRVKFGSETGEQDTDRDGIPLWNAQVKILFEDQDGDPTNEVIRITFPSQAQPTGLIDQAITTEGLIVGASTSGRLWFRAMGLRPQQSKATS